jgi:hypothetical protein
MYVSSTVFSIPKLGNNIEENDDSYFPLSPLDVNSDYFCFALADGATESPLSKQWANYLTNSICSNPQNPDLNVIISEWQKKRRDYLTNAGNPKQWWEEIINSSPSFSTLLYLFINNQGEQSGEFTAFAVGDTCLFQIRENKLILKFPIETPNDFGNRPFLISSDFSINSKLDDFKKEQIGNWQRRDQFYLMTDALAQWFLSMTEKNLSPWTIFNEFHGIEAELKFEGFIDSLRNQNKIKNDDTTLFSIYID